MGYRRGSHATQLNEAVWLAVLARLLIRWRRRGVADPAVLGRYLVLVAGFRFVLEFVRVNPEVALGVTAIDAAEASYDAVFGWLSPAGQAARPRISRRW